MRKAGILLSLMISLGLVSAIGWAQEAKKPKLILLIAEQNISGPQTGWWASEVDLSATEAVLARKMTLAGYEIVEPGQLESLIKKDKAFRTLDLAEKDYLKLGNLSKADYIVIGKAVASSGGFVPQSSMRSCFANLSAKLLRAKDGKMIAYLDAAGNSAHPDVITGGREALAGAAGNLAPKLVEAISKEEKLNPPASGAK